MSMRSAKMPSITMPNGTQTWKSGAFWIIGAGRQQQADDDQPRIAPTIISA